MSDTDPQARSIGRPGPADLAGPAVVTATPYGVGATSDAALVAGCAGGDQRAFRELLTRHLTVVLATARRILGEESEAEDVAQEAMLRLWTLSGSVAVPEHGIRPWLRRVATNLALDRVRSRRRVDVTDDPPEIPQAPEQGRALDAASRRSRVAGALAGLPERQRLAVTLFHFEGMSQAEVASSLAISEEAVESLLARGRRALKVALADDWRMLISDEDGV